MRLRYYQEDAIANVEKALSRVRSTLVQLPTGCHEPDQLVLKHDGSIVRACDVKKGDLLMGPDSQPREVVRLVNGEAPMVRILPEKGRSFIVTADHLLTYSVTGHDGVPRLSEMVAGGWFDLHVVDQFRLRLVRCTPGGMTFLGFSVELLDADREYFGWTVEGADHRYLLDDLTITHNCGKTVVFNDLASRYAQSMRRTLILAHREELIFQAATALERATGIKAAIEKAERAEAHEIVPSLLEAGSPGVGPDGKPLVVVGSVQSMVRRLDKFRPDHFDLVVVDECHHAPAKTYRDILEHFSEAKVLGVSATPERSDQVALGSIFDDVAYRYEIVDGIEDGWLVPIHQQVVQTQHLDLSKVRTTAGDLNLGDLEAAMTQTDLLHEIAGPAVELSGDRQGIVFAVTVEHAYLLAEAMREQIADRWRTLGRGTPPTNIVMALDGTTDVDERRETIEAFRRGDVQFLLNCALFVEGTDLPSVGVVVMAAPTKSRARYCQMVGRGTRPLPGIVDAHPGREDAALRRSAIALSEKTHCLVIDFTENSGKHKLISATDLLAGKYSEPELAMAKAMLARHEVKDILEALRRARAKIKEMEDLRAQARKGYAATTIDPFDPLDILDPSKPRAGGPAVSDKQRRVLKEYGVENVESLDAVQAAGLLKTVAERKAAGLADFNQVRVLMRRGGIRADRAVGLTSLDAAGYIAKLAKNGWRRPPSWDIKFGPETR